MNVSPHYLFAVWMVGGIQTVFDNLQEVIGPRADARSSWLPVEMYPDDWVTKIPPISFYGMWRTSMATWMRIRPLEKQQGPVNAAYFLEHSLIPPPWVIQRKVPYLLSTDMTPLFCARHELWYAVPRFDPETVLSRLKQHVTSRLYSSAFHLLPWSTDVRDSLVEEYGIPEQRVTVLPPGINLRRWSAADRTSRMTNGRAGIFKVLHVGWDFQRKGGDMLVALAAEPEFRDVEFHFVTSSAVRGATPNVIVHPDLAPNSPALIALYHDADVFVLPTRADTYSMVSLEAMATGLPVIVSKVGGIGDIVEEGETGFLVRPGDTAMVRERLRQLRSRPADRIAMGARARRRMERHFDLDHHAEAVLQLLTQAARSRVGEVQSA